ncbi:MAG: DUF4838 domain-containing protein [Clostridiales bacterium]|nr:DUF4838 domain-containing protein [Clostridiales bacterium]
MKNKIISKIICFCLVALTFTTFCVSGCKSGAGKTQNKGQVKVTYDGTHIYTAPDTSDYLVKNGRCDYVLVVPKNESDTIKEARKEFIHLFKKATNIELNYIYDTDLTHNASSRYISLGKTTLLASSGIEIDHAKLGSDGGVILTKDKSIYICGGQDWGTLFAVYTFMSITFNYETYHIDCMEIDENVYNKSLKAYEVMDIPDFAHRACNNNTITDYSTSDYDESHYRYRLRQKGNRAYTFMPVYIYLGEPERGGMTSTNSIYWLPKNVHKEAHPGWYSDNGDELCFTAHGDEKEYKLMLEECLKKIKMSLQINTINKSPHFDAMTLTQQDFNGYCTCKGCQDIYKKYDNRAAVQLLFMNDLGKILDEAEIEWKKEEAVANEGKEEKDKIYWVRDEFYILFFAYSYTSDPPAKYDFEQEKWVPIADELVCRDNVGIFYANSGTTSKSFFSDSNQSVRDGAEGWGAITDNIYLWQYGTNFRNFMLMNDSFNYYTPDTYAYYANFSNRQWFIEMQAGSKGRSLTAWHNLKLYLDAKLSWDTSLDYQTLIENWFNAMYKDAAKAMLNAFKLQRAYFAGTISGDQPIVGATNEILTREVFPYPMIKSWLKMFDDALKDAERYKIIDAEEYDKICQHIEAEAVSPLYIILKLYDGKITTTERDGYVNRLLRDIEWIDLREMSLSDGTLLKWLENTYGVR